MQPSLEQRLSGETLTAGAPLTAWLTCGLFEFQPENPGRFFSTLRQTWEEEPLKALLDDLAGAAQARPVEGDPLSLWGQERFWCLTRQRGHYFGFGQFTIVPQVSAMLMTTEVTVEQPLKSAWCWEVSSASHTQAWLDGEPVRGCVYGDDRNPMRSDSFSLDLAPGRHRLTVALACCRAMQKIASRLVLKEAAGATLLARAPFKGGLAERVFLERTVAAFRPATRAVAPGKAVTYTLPQDAPGLPGEVRMACAGNELAEGPAESGSNIVVPLPPRAAGEVTLTLIFTNAAGERLTHREDTLRIREEPWGTAVPDGYPARCREALDAALASGTRSGMWNTAIWDALAWVKVRKSRPPDTWLQAAVDWLDERRDCADFTMQGLLRLLWLDDREGFLDAAWRDRIRDTLLGFCYALEDIDPPTMFMGSENHRFLFHSGGWLAGLRYPDAVFTASGLSGRALAARSRMRTLEWLRQRGRFGFSEWHSACYLPVNLEGLLNLCDHLRRHPWLDHTGAPLAEGVTDLIFYILAADHFEGALIGSQGRAYARSLLLPELDSTAALCRLAYGVGPCSSAGRSATISLATSDYRPPEWFTDLALDPAPREACYRQGLSKDGDSVQYSLRRTGDYGLGVIERGANGRTAGGCYVRILLPGGIGVFGSATLVDVVSSVFRPDYWSGNETGCRAMRRAATLLLRWDDQPAGILTHFFLPLSRFDESARVGEWIIARAGKGWIALACSAPFRVATEGDYAGEELVCDQPGACWAIECGGAGEGRPYREACERLRTTPPPQAAPGTAAYHSPWAGDLTLPCEEQPLREDFAAGAELTGRFGSGELALCYEGRQRLLWFNL